ncbi:MAG TPA: GNAT family N-acetyltransferase [Nannocystis sp.]
MIELRALDGACTGPDHLFAICLRGTATQVGELLVRLDHDDPGLVAYAGHIGFEVLPAHRGHRHALRATRLVSPLARRHGFSELWLMTAPDNAASRRTLELLGAQHVDTVEVPVDSDMRKLGFVQVRRYHWILPLAGDERGSTSAHG